MDECHPLGHRIHPPASAHRSFQQSPVSAYSDPPRVWEVPVEVSLPSSHHQPHPFQPPGTSLTPAHVWQVEHRLGDTGDIYKERKQQLGSPLSSKRGGENHRCKFPQQCPARLLLPDSSPLALDLQRERSLSLRSCLAGWKQTPTAQAEGCPHPRAGLGTLALHQHPPQAWLSGCPAGVPITLPTPPGSLGRQGASHPTEAHSTVTAPDF